MTDIEMERKRKICTVAGVDDIGNLSDGFHTFNSLYEQRMILFAALVKAYKNKAWKSYRHENGEYCFGGGWFIVGIDTPKGSYTYHYENKYFDMFDCVELPRAKHWDGHTEADANIRLMSLEQKRWIPCSEKLPEKKGWYQCTIVVNDWPRTMDLFYKNGKWIDNRRVDMLNTYEIYGYGCTEEKHKLSYQELISEFDWTEYVTAWMPRPLPYTAESKERYNIWRCL